MSYFHFRGFFGLVILRYRTVRDSVVRMSSITWYIFSHSNNSHFGVLDKSSPAVSRLHVLSKLTNCHLMASTIQAAAKVLLLVSMTQRMEA